MIQLDHSQPGLRAYVVDAITFWVEEVGVDGFCFDAVSFEPRDFWWAVLPAVREMRPDLLFLAEGDGPEWHADGFDQTYGWGLYGFEGGVLKRIADGRNTALNLGAYLNRVDRAYPEEACRLYFISNHDENAWHTAPAELFGDAAEVGAVLTATIEGMPLVYSGQETGLGRRLAFFDKDQIVWRDHPNADLYTALFQEKQQNEVLWNGTRGGDLPGPVHRGGGHPRRHPLVLDPWDYVAYTRRDMATDTDAAPVPSTFALAPFYPNPTTGRATVAFTLPEATDVDVRIVDALGREVRRLDAGTLAPGLHTHPLDTAGLPSGVYVCHLRAGGEVATQRFTVAR